MISWTVKQPSTAVFLIFAVGYPSSGQCAGWNSYRGSPSLSLDIYSFNFIRLLVPLPSQLHRFINATRMGIALDFLRIHLLTLFHLARSQIYRLSTTHTSQQLGPVRRRRPSPSALQHITSAVFFRAAHPLSLTQHQGHSPMCP